MDLNNDTTNSNGPISTSIAAWLSVGDAAGAVHFYKAAFGAMENYRLEMPDGGLVVKLAIGGSEFWVSGEGTSEGSPIPAPLGGTSIKMVLTVADPDALYAQALAAGATEVFAVAEAHGWRLGLLVDPFGLHWEIGRPL